MKFACCNSVSSGSAGSITCSKCTSCYHYQCLNPSEKRKDLSLDSKKSWICPTCSSLKPKAPRKDNTPVRSQYSNTSPTCDENVNIRRGGSSAVDDDALHDSIDKSSLLELIRSVISSELKCLKGEFKDNLAPLQGELRAIKEDFLSIKQSLEFINNKFEDLNKKFECCEKNVQQLTHKCLELGNIKKSIESIEEENNNREQWARRSNVEIYGIPERKNENLFTLL